MPPSPAHRSLLLEPPARSRFLPLPSAFDLVPDLLAARAEARHLFIGLDFDGTLAPIVGHPDDARLDGHVRDVLVRLAARADTVVAVLSGRGLADVRERVGVPNLFFAGNHGLEIEGPGITQLHPAAAAAVPTLRALGATLCAELAQVEGAIVEDKGVSLSVHYRLVAGAAAQERTRTRVRELATGRPGVRVTEGKMVVEVRPDVAWHKGAALTFLRRALHEDAGAPALFIGDDRTDEDAFRELGAGGWGILVAEDLPAETAARAWLRDPEQVATLLAQLSEGPS